MNEIFITDASAIFTEKLTQDDTIIKGDKFYFGKLKEDFEPINNERYDLRCNRVLKYLVDKLDLSGFEKDEIGIVIGTTNSGIEEFETTKNKHHAEFGNPAEFLKFYLGTTNYAACVSTACTSGVKVFSTARKLLENGVCKAVITGGVDTIASMPSYGFHALEVLSHEKTNPFSKNRNGISLGEGGALFVVTKAAEQLGSEAAKRNCHLEKKQLPSVVIPSDSEGIQPINSQIKIKRENRNNLTETDQASSPLSLLASRHQNDVGIAMPTYKIPSCSAVSLLGIGETSDAYHAATPDPDGIQAVKAIQTALDDANLKPEDIDYINLHGTGTISNDLMEANAIYKVFGDKVPASSTKPLTGHCLGAAASIEAFICYQILKGERNLPIHKFDGEYDETLPKINLVTENTPQKEVKVCMSTSFGFGGTNAVVVLAAKQLGSEAAKRNCHLEKKQLPSVVIPSDSEGIQPINNQIKTKEENRNNLTETDQASSSLSLLASNQQNDVGIAMPTYKTTSNLAAQPPSCLAASCLPHSAPMVLIDEVLNVDMENQIVKTSVKIHDDKIFFNKEINGISPLVGIEFMAQTIGCYAYYKAGKTIPKIGFLLGTRQYENKLEKFENGKTYILTAREIYGDNELVSFECLIYNEGEDENLENYIAKATINAFQPKDVEKYIKELG